MKSEQLEFDFLTAEADAAANAIFRNLVNALQTDGIVWGRQSQLILGIQREATAQRLKTLLARR